jgi:hypothetical protein
VINILTSALIYFFTALLFILVMSGWGLLSRKLLKIELKSTYFSSIVLLGFIILSTFIEVYHFFMPIDWRLSFFVVALGLYTLKEDNFFVLTNFYNSILKSAKSNLIFTFSIGLIFIYWCLRISKVSTNYDTAAYHLQTIRWLNEYSAVLGLGNLFGHLAYNQSYFEFLALLKFFPFFNEGFVVGGLIFFIISGLVLVERYSTRYINFSILAISLYLLSHLAGSTMFSPSPDLIVAFFEIIIFTLFLNFIFEKSNDIKNKELLPLLLLSTCYLFTVKLSAIVFASMTFLATLIIAYHDNKIVRINLYKFVLLGGFICVIHIINGYLMTGMPLYPSSFARIGSLPWTVPLDQANQEVIDIYQATRGINIVATEANWFSVWLKNLTWVNWFYIYAVIFFTFLNGYLIIIKGFLRKESRGLSLFCISTLLAILFWFYQAPDFRYLCALLDIYLSGSLIFLLSLITKKSPFLFVFSPKRSFHLIVGILLFITLLSFDSKLLTLPKEVVLYPKVVSEKTPSGILLNIPEGLCWDSPLPCVYSYNKNLLLLNPSDVSSGFKIGH